jgi:hypothetical protein
MKMPGPDFLARSRFAGNKHGALHFRSTKHIAGDLQDPGVLPKIPALLAFGSLRPPRGIDWRWSHQPSGARSARLRQTPRLGRFNTLALILTNVILIHGPTSIQRAETEFTPALASPRETISCPIVYNLGMQIDHIIRNAFPTLTAILAPAEKFCNEFARSSATSRASRLGRLSPTNRLPV